MDIVTANLFQYDNETFSESVQFTKENTGEGLDFTGSTFEMDIKVNAEDVAVAASATLGVTEIDEGIIAITVAMGALDIGLYVYDLVRITGPTRTVIMTGKYTVEEGVTEL